MEVSSLLLVDSLVVSCTLQWLIVTDSLEDSPRGLYEIRATIEHKEEPYYLQYTVNELLNDNSTIQHGDPVVIYSSPLKETESLEEFDFMDDVKKVVSFFLYDLIIG